MALYNTINTRIWRIVTLYSRPTAYTTRDNLFLYNTLQGTSFFVLLVQVPKLMILIT